MFSTPPKREEKYFLALDIEQEVITAGLWGHKPEGVYLVKTSSPIEWDAESGSDIAEAADVALEELGADAEHVGDVIYGLQEDWVGKDGIKEEKKTLLRALGEKLSLKPVGFVVTTEALIQFLSEQEGSSLNTILVQYTTSMMQMSLVRSGKLVRSESVGRSTNTVADIIEGITRLPKNLLPSQIYIYSARLKQEELEQEKQALIAYDWQSSSLFLHLPTVNILPQKIRIESICITGGAAVVKSLHTENPVSSPEPLHEQQASEQGKTQVDSTFGFHDVEQKQEEVIDKTHGEESPIEEGETVAHVEHVHPPMKPRISLPSVRLPVLRMPKLKLRMRLPLLFGVIALILFVLVGGVWAMKMNAKARVLITLKTMPLTKTADLSLQTSGDQTDQFTAVPAITVTKQVTGEKTGPATGTRLVGDKAKGNVTIFNATSSNKSFPEGTVLTYQNKKFSLNESITIASSSGSASSPQPGKGTVAVTAEQIGADSNIPAKSELGVANFDKVTYVAVNDDAFSGGSSREVQVVSKEDQTSLRKALLATLRTEAAEALTQEQEPQTFIIPLDSVEVTEEKYSSEIGKEAQTLELSMTVSVKHYDTQWKTSCL